MSQTLHLPEATYLAYRYLVEESGNHTDSSNHTDDGHHGDGEAHSEFGVHITYEDLYDFFVFLVCIYVGGQIASRLLRMPNLVGEIVVGILLGPPLADYVPLPEAWVLLGEIGLILLVLEAGIDIDVTTLKLIGTRGMLIAVIGSLLPIAIGIILAGALYGFDDVRTILAAGATFGPTSLGIALNILRSGGVLNTPIGQLIISAAVIDDMIALIILSLLQSLVGTLTAASIVIPIVSAIAFLVIGGYIALYIFPDLLQKYVVGRFNEDSKGKVELGAMFGILLGMMPATHYAEASYLMGAFISGLGFCTSHELHLTFIRQFKRVLQWLMRIFFAASIGFQVPIRDFGNGTVIWQGLVFTIALVGKLAVGFLVPNFTQSRRFTQFHLRDCLITGFSMAAEGEFAFVIAVFSVDSGLITKDIYASVVLAVLLSTIIPPFLLRFTISYYNKKAEETVQAIADAEMERKHNLEEGGTDASSEEHEAQIHADIRNKTAVFLCIQTQSMAKWGLLPSMLSTLTRLGVDVIDHRSWHPRGINSPLVTEVYVKDKIEVTKGSSQEALDARMQEITEALEKKINQPEARVKVQRWYPGVVEEIVEDVDEQQKVTGGTKLNLEERLHKEASEKLNRKQQLQMTATKEKTVDEILAGMQTEPSLPAAEEGGKPAELGEVTAPKRARRRRQKMRSTPVVGGGLFGETEPSHAQEEKVSGGVAARPGTGKWTPDFAFPSQRGHKAEIIVDGESYNVRISDETLKALRTGFSGDFLDRRGLSVEGVSLEPDSSDVVNQLQGYIRTAGPLGRIVEETDGHEDESETSSVQDGAKNKS